MIRVLLVDDHPVVRSGYQRLLAQDGGVQVVAEADTAARGLQAFLTHQPDITITDLSMPGGGGLSLLDDIVRLQPQAKVLVCSMHDSPLMVDTALAHGACGFVSKNASPDELVNAVYAAQRGQRMPRQDLREQDTQAQLEQARVASLTPRERDIWRLLAQGLSAAECAQALQLSLKTVANNQSLIKEKLGVGSSTALVHLAQRHGIISSPLTPATPLSS